MTPWLPQGGAVTKACCGTSVAAENVGVRRVAARPIANATHGEGESLEERRVTRLLFFRERSGRSCSRARVAADRRSRCLVLQAADRRGAASHDRFRRVRRLAAFAEQSLDL